MWTRPLGRVVLGVLALIVIAVVWFLLQVDPIFAGKGREVVISVQPGESFSSILGELHDKGVIASPFAFRLESVVLGSPDARAGTYELRKGSSFATVRSVLSHVPNVFVVEPGLTLHEVAVKLIGVKSLSFANQFAADATASKVSSPYAKGASLEGLIASGNYLITPSTTPSGLAQTMVARFDKEATTLGLTPSTTVNGLDAYQLIIAASIDEKEGYYPENMPQVARVIFNRLALGGPLQMDSTVLYYFGQDGGTVTQAMLQTQTPYNTYLYPGLTPTPICTVSKDSLKAVLHAPSGSWLYFTLINKDGTMAFSTTFAQQLKNEAIGQKHGIK
ncbi:MAG: Endolytic murein transglycosylase [Acidimicrobiaceae bacterium]|nr:Endolytic murein transglycosylase [Acidimicrobiaceae bacterium]